MGLTCKWGKRGIIILLSFLGVYKIGGNIFGMISFLFSYKTALEKNQNSTPNKMFILSGSRSLENNPLR